MTWHLQNEGHAVNEKRIRRLMRLMRLMPIYQKPDTRCPATHACMCEREQARGSPKYECVYLHAWETGSQARAGVSRWITFNNHLRPHAAHGAQAPAVAYYNATETDQKLQAVA
ncbi:MAG: integrase core domain-containing protein [Cypionkella sp.]